MTGAIDYSGGFLPTIGVNSASTTNDAFVGRIDDVRFYNRSLSSTEVTQLYAFESDLPVITSQPQART